MKKVAFISVASVFVLSACIDNDVYSIENGVRLNKKTGEMIAISGDSFKVIEEFKIEKKNSPVNNFNKMDIPILKDENKAEITLVTKYKNGALLYKAQLEIKQLGVSNHEFLKKNISSSVSVNFVDEDGFGVGPVITLSPSTAISNHSAAAGDVSITWEGKHPITLPDYESIKVPVPMWTQFTK